MVTNESINNTMEGSLSNSFQKASVSESTSTLPTTPKGSLDPPENDGQLLSSPVGIVLEFFLKAWSKENNMKRNGKVNVDHLKTDPDNRPLDFGNVLVKRAKAFVMGELINNDDLKGAYEDTAKKRKGDGSIKEKTPNPFDLLRELKETINQVPGFSLGDMHKHRHNNGKPLPDFLGLNGITSSSSSSPIDMVNTSMNVKSANNHSSREDKSWAISLLRSLMAHLVTYEDHIKPQLDGLRAHWDDQSRGSKKEMRVQIVTIYARHTNAMHCLLVAHPDAVEHLTKDILHFMALGQGNSSGKKLSIDSLQEISHELRDHIPSLCMPHDSYYEESLRIRKKYPHLETLYNEVHNAICQAAFKENCAHGGGVDPSCNLCCLLDILGGDLNLAKELGSSTAVSNMQTWATIVVTYFGVGHEFVEDMSRVSQIVSILSEACDLFPAMKSYNFIRIKLENMLADHINENIPSIAAEEFKLLQKNGRMVPTGASFGFINILIVSPNWKNQGLGLRALHRYLEPFVMGHYQKHKEIMAKTIEDQTKLQKERLGDAYQHFLRPYDRPNNTLHGNDQNLSLSHLGPLPPHKGHCVQVQLDRNAIHAGSMGGIYPIVVMVGPSGVGKSDLLEQLSKYHINENGNQETNYAEILLPLKLNSLGEKRYDVSVDLRSHLEKDALLHIFSQIMITIALFFGHKREKTMAPTPHDIFRYFNNGGGSFVQALAEQLASAKSEITFSTVYRCRGALLSLMEQAAKKRLEKEKPAEEKIEIHAQVSFAIDEVNTLAEMYNDQVRKSSDSHNAIHSRPTGSLLTAVSHVIQQLGTSVYAGTGLRYGLIEKNVSALGKEILVMAPSFPPLSFRAVVYVLRRLLGFEKLKNGKGVNPLTSIEVYMLRGRLRFLELFMLEVLKLNSNDNRSLVQHDRPEFIFHDAMLKAEKSIQRFVQEDILSKLQRSENDKALHSAFELASSGVMRVEGKPGDPRNADNILVRCGLVQLDDETAHLSQPRVSSPCDTASDSSDHYFFMNREPMMQYALSETLFRSDNGIEEGLTKLQNHIWKERVEPRNDANQNGLEVLGWLLLRAMSRDAVLQTMLIGNDDELAQYVNETSFVWCDPSDGSLKGTVEPWIVEHEKEYLKIDKPNSGNDGTKSKAATPSFIDILQEGHENEKVKGIYGTGQCAEDMWFHVAHLQHSDAKRVHFLSRAVVMPPQELGSDLVGSWRHKTDGTKEPLLMLVSISTRRDEDKLRADAFFSHPKNLGSRVAKGTGKVVPTEYFNMCKPLHGRRALRILLHPNLIPGESMNIGDIASAYNITEQVVRDGHGRDEDGNFVVLLNRKTLGDAIHQHKVANERSFVAMVIGLWKLFLKKLEDYEQKEEGTPNNLSDVMDNESSPNQTAEGAADTQIIHLNVGGKSFTTKKTTLNDTRLAEIVSEDSITNRDDKGAIFIDRNPKHFELILDFLRGNEDLVQMKIEVMDRITLSELLAEVQFYQIQPFVDAVKAQLIRFVKPE